MKTILVAEDDDDDFFFTARSLRKVCAAQVNRVESGREAIDYLAAQGSYGDRAAFPFPDLMFLDLKMGEVDGHAVIAWIRGHLSPGQLPLYVLTGSGELRDRALVATAGVARGYLVKPLAQHNLPGILSAVAVRPTVTSL